MRVVLLLPLLAICTLCSAQQVHLSYTPSGELTDGIFVVATPTFIRAFRSNGHTEVKKEISQDQFVQIASQYREIAKQELSRPVSIDPLQIGDPKLQIHIFVSDQTFSFSANPSDEEAGRFLLPMRGLIERLDEMVRQKPAEPGATDNPDDAQ